MIRKIKVKKIRKYVPVRMPLEAYKNYLKRQEKMEQVVKRITRKVVRIPLTKVFVVSSENPINLPDEYVLGLSKKRRRKI